jgi:hypothetical protein
MAENALVVPNKADVPAYILNPELARAQNEDAAAGISTGVPARIKANGKQFNLVDGNGEEKPYPPAKMVAGPDGNVYLRVIVLRAKKEISKTLYLKAYNPANPPEAPDCQSSDGIRPDAAVLTPQSDQCATCQFNAWGSGIDQNGAPTKGKRCADAKILAVVVPEYGVFELKIMPASLKNFGLYVKSLSGAGIPLGMAQTLIGFDMTASFPVYVFNFGGYVPEKSVAKLAELAQSPEVEEIVGRSAAAPRALPANPTPAPAHAPAPAPDPSATVEAEAKKKADAAAKRKAAAEAKAKKEAEEKAAAAKAAQNVDLDLGLDDDQSETVEPELVSAGGAGPTDDELRLELGL